MTRLSFFLNNSQSFSLSLSFTWTSLVHCSPSLNPSQFISSLPSQLSPTHNRDRLHHRISLLSKPFIFFVCYCVSPYLFLCDHPYTPHSLQNHKISSKRWIKVTTSIPLSVTSSVWQGSSFLTRTIEKASRTLGEYHDLQRMEEAMKLIRAFAGRRWAKDRQSNALSEWLRQIKHVFSNPKDIIHDSILRLKRCRSMFSMEQLQNHFKCFFSRSHVC